jgi:hypothetical protein
VLLLEGKLIFKKKATSESVKKYLQEKFDGTHEVIENQPRNWPHWGATYASELYLRII